MNFPLKVMTMNHVPVLPRSSPFHLFALWFFF